MSSCLNKDLCHLVVDPLVIVDNVISRRQKEILSFTQDKILIIIIITDFGRVLDPPLFV